MIGAAVLAEARAMVGVPWRHMGRSTAGVDCIGLILLAAFRAGVALPEPAPYAREPQDHALRAALGERWLGLSLQRFGSDKRIPCRLICTLCRCRGVAQGGRSPTGVTPRHRRLPHAAI